VPLQNPTETQSITQRTETSLAILEVLDLTNAGPGPCSGIMRMPAAASSQGSFHRSRKRTLGQSAHLLANDSRAESPSRPACQKQLISTISIRRLFALEAMGLANGNFWGFRQAAPQRAMSRDATYASGTPGSWA
jgi:hypothetical protein